MSYHTTCSVYYLLYMQMIYDNISHEDHSSGKYHLHKQTVYLSRTWFYQRVKGKVLKEDFLLIAEGISFQYLIHDMIQITACWRGVGGFSQTPTHPQPKAEITNTFCIEMKNSSQLIHTNKYVRFNFDFNHQSVLVNH